MAHACPRALLTIQLCLINLCCAVHPAWLLCAGKERLCACRRQVDQATQLGSPVQYACAPKHIRIQRMSAKHDGADLAPHPRVVLTGPLGTQLNSRV